LLRRGSESCLFKIGHPKPAIFPKKSLRTRGRTALPV
jgi:hypothetical protein